MELGVETDLSCSAEPMATPRDRGLSWLSAVATPHSVAPQIKSNSRLSSEAKPRSGGAAVCVAHFVPGQNSARAGLRALVRSGNVSKKNRKVAGVLSS